MVIEVTIILVLVSAKNCENCKTKAKMEKLLHKVNLKRIEAVEAKNLDQSNQE